MVVNAAGVLDPPVVVEEAAEVIEETLSPAVVEVGATIFSTDWRAGVVEGLLLMASAEFVPGVEVAGRILSAATWAGVPDTEKREENKRPSKNKPTGRINR